jgi:hypothetical protein
MGRLVADTAHRGLYRPNASMQVTANGNFTPGDLAESVKFPGYFEFEEVDPTVPQLTYLPPLGGFGPRVEVFIEEMARPRVDVWRTVAGRRSLVRGGVGRATGGGLLLVDSEVPFGVPATYQAGVEFEDGSADYSPPATITLDAATMGADWGKTFVHNVLGPSRGIEYRPLADAFGELNRETPGDLYTPQGRSKPQWVGGARSGLQDVNLSGYTETQLEADRLDRMLGNPDDPDDGTIPILVFRTPPSYPIPGTFVCVVEKSSARPLARTQSGEGVLWPLVGTEVEPPFEGLSEPVVTWSDVAARYPEAADYAAAYPTINLHMSRDYSLSALTDD